MPDYKEIAENVEILLRDTGYDEEKYRLIRAYVLHALGKSIYEDQSLHLKDSYDHELRNALAFIEKERSNGNVR